MRWGGSTHLALDAGASRRTLYIRAAALFAAAALEILHKHRWRWCLGVAAAALAAGGGRDGHHLRRWHDARGATKKNNRLLALTAAYGAR